MGAGPPECMHLRGLRVTAAGGTVTEAGEGRPDFDALCCDRALDGLPELERGEGQTCGLCAPCSDSTLRWVGHKPACLFRSRNGVMAIYHLTSFRVTIPMSLPILVTYAWSTPSSEKMV